MHRLFVAIRPPEPIRDLLIDAMDEGPELRWVGDDNLHLTLRFIGEVERPMADDIAGSLASVRSPEFELRLNGVGRFDRRGGGAVWAGVEPRAPVVELAARIERSLVRTGLKPERRAFHPHITLARYRRGDGDAARGFERKRADLSSPPFAVDRFMLFESHLSRHGAHYVEVASYALSAPPPRE
ncbi:MAG TPA: RNA 2',3'-cyclic phosphodiesterase [Sphingomicrobium sp.]|nr:RNA 2',3'-cyclic phosphodiesterase [Sphingomicrobium sp.]